jgi:hypothetical protein
MQFYLLFTVLFVAIMIVRLVSFGRSLRGDAGVVLGKVDATARERIMGLIKSGNKIAAIKELRGLVDTDLLTAKTAVERMAEGRD